LSSPVKGEKSDFKGSPDFWPGSFISFGAVFLKMTTTSIEKLYVILGNRDEAPIEKVEGLLSRLFPYLNMACNIYVAAPGLSEGISPLERIQKGLKAFLRANRFVRYYLHFLHPVPRGGVDDLDYYDRYYYQSWRRGSAEFDREGYAHQEVPRLVLFTLVAPSQGDETRFVEKFLGMLKGAFLFPSLYVHENTFHWAENRDANSKIKKVYYGSGDSATPADMVCQVSAQDLVEAACVALRSGRFFPAACCGSSLFVAAERGLVYPCMDAFSKGQALAAADENMDLEAVLGRCQTERDCRTCREQVIARFSRLPLPENLRNEVDVLVRHLGVRPGRP
jgi:hypothetical protein